MAGKPFLLCSAKSLCQIVQASSFCSFLSHCRSMQFLPQPPDSRCWVWLWDGQLTICIDISEMVFLQSVPVSSGLWFMRGRDCGVVPLHATLGGGGHWSACGCHERYLWLLPVDCTCRCCWEWQKRAVTVRVIVHSRDEEETCTCR